MDEIFYWGFFLEPCISLIYVVRTSLDTNPILNITSTAAQLSISQKALGTLPEDGYVVMPKHVETTIHN
jgi:hypothetical protein